MHDSVSCELNKLTHLKKSSTVLDTVREGKLNLLTTYYVPVSMLENACAKMNKACPILSNC